MQWIQLWPDQQWFIQIRTFCVLYVSKKFCCRLWVLWTTGFALRRGDKNWRSTLLTTINCWKHSFISTYNGSTLSWILTNPPVSSKIEPEWCWNHRSTQIQRERKYISLNWKRQTENADEDNGKVETTNVIINKRFAKLNWKQKVKPNH